MATNASCAIVIEGQADQVGSANDFTRNGVPKKRKASEITDFVINAIGFFMPKRKASGAEPQTPMGELTALPHTP